jgi:phospholipase C
MIQFDYEAIAGDHYALTGNGLLHLANTDNRPFTIEVIDNAYGAAHKLLHLPTGGAPSPLLIPLTTSHGWYDFSVGVKYQVGFEKRYAGRIETGRNSISDPYMGRTVKS